LPGGRGPVVASRIVVKLEGIGIISWQLVTGGSKFVQQSYYSSLRGGSRDCGGGRFDEFKLMTKHAGRFL
jgi:hypothetical protein